MQSDSIVIAFDITEDFRAGFLDRRKDAAIDQFRLEPGKEAFRLRVIVTISIYSCSELAHHQPFPNLKFSYPLSGYFLCTNDQYLDGKLPNHF